MELLANKSKFSGVDDTFIGHIDNGPKVTFASWKRKYLDYANGNRYYLVKQKR